MECNKINGGDSFRDASFSYLRSDHQQQSLTNPRGSAASRTSLKISTDHEAEISVFGAERYFSTPISASEDDGGSSSRRLNLHRRSADDHLPRRLGTPCSEGSWTSRSTALLLKSSSARTDAGPATSASRKPASYGCFRTRRRLVSGSKSLFATLGCTGKCSGEKSVFVAGGGQQKAAGVVESTDGQVPPETKDRLRYDARSTKRAEEHFAFPILSTAGANSTDGDGGSSKSAVVVLVAEDEPPRMSLEVFGSKPTPKSGNDGIDEVAMNLERKLSVLTWDAIPSAKPYSKTLSPKSTSSVGRHDDLDSDASSDLFEIENMVVMSAAAGRRGPPLEGEEEAGAMSPPPCGYHYEPSEASIEWSVVTASCGGGAGDPGSDYDEKRLSANRRPPTQHKARRSGGGGILGCKSQKSVRVAENAHTTS